MNHKRVWKIFEKYRKGKSSREENSLVESWYLHYENPNAEPLTEEQFARIENQRFVYPEKKVRPILRWRVAAAAAVLILSAISVVIYNGGGASEEPLPAVEFVVDYEPSANQAVLKVGGRTFELNTEKAGIRVSTDGVSYLGRNTEDMLVAINDKDDEVQTMTVETSKGGKFQVILPDGSAVWLNSSSRLTYPERFAANERVVELSGEAYFEVHHVDENYPFMVKSGGQTTEVLGTRFNVNAYDIDTKISTTLLEGRVQVAVHKSESTPQILSPNQQSVWDGQSTKIQVRDVDASQAISWLRGLFSFDDMRLEDILAEISRWYGVDVFFEEKSLKDERFGGSVSRDASLSEVLKILTLTETVKFKIENNQKRIIVKK